MVEWFLIWLGTFHLEMWSNNNRQKRRLFCYCYYSQSDSLLIVQSDLLGQLNFLWCQKSCEQKLQEFVQKNLKSFKCKLLENICLFLKVPIMIEACPRISIYFFELSTQSQTQKKSKRNCSVRLLHVIMFQNGSIVEKQL